MNPLVNALQAAARHRQSSVDLLTGLIAYWKMDETSGNAIDAHSNSLNLTANNSPAYDTGKVYDNARTFYDTAVRYFSRADEDLLSVNGSDFSFSFWVYATSLSSTGNWLINKRINDMSGVEFQINISSSTGSIDFSCGNGTDFFTATTAITLNAWHLINCWFDNTKKTVNIQLNNETPMSVSFTGNIPESASSFAIGAAAWYLTSLRLVHRGRLGPIAFWKGRTLSETDRAWLWNSGNGRKYSEF